MFKSVGSESFFLINTLNWAKVTEKTFTLLQKKSISNKCCYFELFHFPYKNILRNKKNMSWPQNQHLRIIIISEGWCDTADWSNDSEIGWKNMCFLHSQKSCSSWCFRSPAGWPHARGGLLCPALRWERCWSAPSYSLSGPPETCCSPPVETDRVSLHHYYLTLFDIVHS